MARQVQRLHATTGADVQRALHRTTHCEVHQGRRSAADAQDVVLAHRPIDAVSTAGFSLPKPTARRLLMTTAPTMRPRASTPTMTRTAVFSCGPCTPYFTTVGAMSNATRFITLMSGLSAGPAVSLNGSPTVSPMTVAACASEPLPPYAPSSTSFLALSQAPPELARKTAISVPVPMAPARYAASGPAPRPKPTAI